MPPLPPSPPSLLGALAPMAEQPATSPRIRSSTVDDILFMVAIVQQRVTAARSCSRGWCLGAKDTCRASRQPAAQRWAQELRDTLTGGSPLRA